MRSRRLALSKEIRARLHLSDEMQVWLDERSKQNHREINAEIVSIMEAVMQEEQSVKIWNVSIVSRNAGKQSKGHYAASSRAEAIEAMKQAWWPQGAPEPFPYQVVASVIEK